MGFVPQTNNVFPSLTIEENLQMGAYQEPDKVTERFDKVAELFPALAIGVDSAPARCPVASARWWPWAGRS